MVRAGGDDKDKNGDMGYTKGGLYTYILDTGDSLYCSVYAMDVMGRKSRNRVSESVTIGEDVSIGSSIYGPYEDNDQPERAKVIYPKTSSRCRDPASGCGSVQRWCRRPNCRPRCSRRSP